MKNVQGDESVTVRKRSAETRSHFVNRNIADLVCVTSPVCKEENVTSSESRFHGFTVDVAGHIGQYLALDDEPVNRHDSR
jgi:hypothetical protein